MESPRKTTSPTPLLSSMRLRKSLCRGMSLLSFRTAGLSAAFSCADRTVIDKLTASTQPAGIRRCMVLFLVEFRLPMGGSRHRIESGADVGCQAPGLIARLAHRRELVLLLRLDRKSTRLNSSHLGISSAVF